MRCRAVSSFLSCSGQMDYLRSASMAYSSLKRFWSVWMLDFSRFLTLCFLKTNAMVLSAESRWDSMKSMLLSMLMNRFCLSQFFIDFSSSLSYSASIRILAVLVLKILLRTAETKNEWKKNEIRRFSEWKNRGSAHCGSPGRIENFVRKYAPCGVQSKADTENAIFWHRL